MVLESIKQANILIPAGTLTNETGSFNIRVPGLFKEIDDLYQLFISKYYWRQLIRINGN